MSSYYFILQKENKDCGEIEIFAHKNEGFSATITRKTCDLPYSHEICRNPEELLGLIAESCSREGGYRITSSGSFKD